jgi:putative ABC transport system substrate-binding protein
LRRTSGAGIHTDMRRREFVGLIGGAAALWSLAAKAQGKLPVIGYLHFATPDYQPAAASFLKGLAETGFIEGKDFSVAYRWAEGHYDRLPAMASELVGLEVDLIAAFGQLPAARRSSKREVASVRSGRDTFGFGRDRQT